MCSSGLRIVGSKTCLMIKTRVHSFSSYCVPFKLGKVLEAWKPER